MKRTIKRKNFISLIAVLILLISIAVTPANAAVNPQWNQFKAFLASALTAINITIESTNAPYKDALEYLADPYNVVYTYPENQVDQFMDRSVIQIWDGYTSIDGVEYTDIWLSHDAAEKFRVNAYDLRSAYNIASNSNGEFASGTGNFNGIPIFEDQQGNLKSQRIQFPSEGTYVVGNGAVRVDGHTGNTYNEMYIQNFPSQVPDSWSRTYYTYYSDSNYPMSTETRVNSGTNIQQYFGTSNNPLATYRTFDNGYVYSPFDFDWVSGTIPADQQLPADDGLMIRVPRDTTGLDDFIHDNPEFQNNEPVTIDVNLDPDINNKISDLMDLIIPIIPTLRTGDIQFIENHEAPAPVIDNLLPDTYKNEILNPIIENQNYNTQQIIEQIPPIIENIPKIDEICNNIDTAPYHDLDIGLDRLPTVFLPFITDLRSALGIWHYVTEWLGMIGSSFAFVTGALTGTAIMTPIYAAIAGYMCIKVYRRMTG